MAGICGLSAVGPVTVNPLEAPGGSVDAPSCGSPEQAVTPIVTLMKKKKFFQRKKARAFKTALTSGRLSER